MNVKVHTPKSMKLGSGMATTKQFLLSLVATTISIILTFGTAAWVDNRKKEEAKREMVMMILYDLATNIEQVEQTDTLLRQGFDMQLKVAENPKLLEQDPFLMTKYIPVSKYTETVERIFSSNIETINTLGNVFFAENVSEFYRLRKMYKTDICDMFMQEIEKQGGLTEYEQVMNIDFQGSMIYSSGILLSNMKEIFARCQEMMDVTTADIETYRQKRQEMNQASATDSIEKALIEEAIRNNQRLNEAVEKGKKALENK